MSAVNAFKHEVRSAAAFEKSAGGTGALANRVEEPLLGDAYNALGKRKEQAAEAWLEKQGRNKLALDLAANNPGNGSQV
jgi:hypothetical protein